MKPDALSLDADIEFAGIKVMPHLHSRSIAHIEYGQKKMRPIRYEICVQKIPDIDRMRMLQIVEKSLGIMYRYVPELIGARQLIRKVVSRSERKVMPIAN